MNLVPLPVTDLNARVERGDYQMALYSIQGGNDWASSLLATFQTDVPANVTGFSSSIYNDQLSQVLSGAIVDDKAVEALYECEAATWRQFPFTWKAGILCWRPTSAVSWLAPSITA